MPRIMAWACGLRTNAACSVSGNCRSSTKRPRPCSNGRSSIRLTGFPMYRRSGRWRSLRGSIRRDSQHRIASLHAPLTRQSNYLATVDSTINGRAHAARPIAAEHTRKLPSTPCVDGAGCSAWGLSANWSLSPPGRSAMRKLLVGFVAITIVSSGAMAQSQYPAEYGSHHRAELAGRHDRRAGAHDRSGHDAIVGPAGHR